MSMTIYDIAEKAGVSVATVSRVLNNSAKVSEKTRQRVLEIMQQEAYTPNIFARGLGLNTIKMIGIMCTDVSDIFYASAVSYLERELRENGFNSILCCTGSKLEDKKKNMAIMLEKHVDAIILVGSAFQESTDNSHIRNAAAGTPVIAINSHINLPGVYSYLCDEDMVTARVVDMLLDKGCRNILFAYDGSTYSTNQKKTGYTTALHRRGMAYNPQLMLDTSRDFARIQTDIHQLLDTGTPLDGVITSADLIAVGVQKALAARGMQLPLVGFDNSLLAQCATPALSSIDNRLEDICTHAVRGLVRLFEGEAPPPYTIFPGQLVQRETFIPSP